MSQADQGGRLLRLAERLTDGEAIDWEHEEQTLPVERGPLRSLRDLHRIGQAHQSVLLGDPVELPFQFWGRLELRERVASGPFGEIFRARDRDLDRTVALKLLPAHGAVGASGDEFVEEARLLAKVRHENVVVVHGVDRFAGRVGLWTEWLEGERLDRLVEQRGPMGAREAAHIGIEMCRALAAVHAAGLVHRDVKLSNVQRERGGRIVLMDFGLSTRRNAADAESPAALAGTPPYIAPEVFEGRDSQERIDLYALGVSLYHLTTGAYPLEAGTLAELRRGHRERSYVSLRTRNASLPTSFVRIVDRALEPDPERRYRNVGEIERDLAQFLSPSDVQVAQPRAWRRALPWLGAAALLAAAAILTARHLFPPFQADAVFYRLNPVRGTEERLVDGARIAPGDQLLLDVQSNRPTWFYVINEDSKGRQHALFPLRGFDQLNPVPTGHHRLPGSADGIEQMWDVDTAGGEDSLLVVASRRPLDFVEARIAALAGSPHGPLDLGDDDLTDRLRGIGGFSRANRPHHSTTPDLEDLRRNVVLRVGTGDDVRVWELRLSNPSTP